MSETPPEVHKRVFREAIENIREYSEFPYVAFTEHLSALVSPLSPSPLHPDLDLMSTGI